LAILIFCPLIHSILQLQRLVIEMKMRAPVVTLIAAMLALSAASASATDFTWTGNVNANFNAAGNWTPAGGPPDAGDSGTINKVANITLSAATGAINTLNINAGGKITTGDHLLDVTGGSNGFTQVVDAGSKLTVSPGGFGRFATDTLSLRLGGELHMDYAGAAINLICRVSSSSVITGRGTIFLTAPGGVGLDLAGSIRPEGGTDLGFASQGATFDLDGNTGGVDFLTSQLDVQYDSDLVFGGAGLADPFSGLLTLGNNRRVEFTTAPFTMDNHGNLNIIAGTNNRLVAPSIDFMSGAAISVQGSDGQFEGTTTFESGVSVFILQPADDLRLQGTATIQSGVNFSGNGALTINNGGSLKLLNGAYVSTLVLQAGTSELVIGSSAGKATVGGFLPSAVSSLKIELGGLTPGTQFDQLAVTGDATLAGFLNVSLLAGFTLDKGESFKILDIAGMRTGTFAGLAEGAKVATLGGKDVFITYAAGDGNDVALFTKGFAADFDNDLDVDGADFLIWQRFEGKASGAVNSQGDADGDHDVDAADLALWKAQFGSVSPPVQAVPEPLAACLLLPAVVSFLRQCAPRKR
jgi:hypothetical protein